MSQAIQPICGDDIFVWPDGTWRYRCEYSSTGDAWKGDDYVVYAVDSPGYEAFIADQEASS